MKKIIISIMITSMVCALAGEQLQSIQEESKISEEVGDNNQNTQDNDDLRNVANQKAELSEDGRFLACAAGCLPEAVYGIAYVWLYLAHRLPVSNKSYYIIYASIPFIIGIGSWICLQKYAEKRINLPNPDTGEVKWNSKTGKQLTKNYCLGLAAITSIGLFLSVVAFILIGFAFAATLNSI